jgi:hypothetical protein
VNATSAVKAAGAVVAKVVANAPRVVESAAPKAAGRANRAKAVSLVRRVNRAKAVNRARAVSLVRLGSPAKVAKRVNRARHVKAAGRASATTSQTVTVSGTLVPALSIVINEPFVKVFTEERELTVMLLVDRSGSQDVGASQRTKAEVAAEIAATAAGTALHVADSALTQIAGLDLTGRIGLRWQGRRDAAWAWSRIRIDAAEPLVGISGLAVDGQGAQRDRLPADW